MDAAAAFRLRDRGLDVLLPRWLPEGFREAGVEVDLDPEWGPSYRAHYRGPGGESLVVEGTLSGFGDIPRGGSRLVFDHPTLGRGTLEVYGEDPPLEVDLRTQWLQPRPAGPGYAVAASGVAPEQAVAVVESLGPAGPG